MVHIGFTEVFTSRVASSEAGVQLSAFPSYKEEYRWEPMEMDADKTSINQSGQCIEELLKICG